MRKLILVSLITLKAVEIFPQVEDTLKFHPSIDSTTYISEKPIEQKDTLKPKRYDVDTTVYANAADSLIFFVKDKKMDLFGNAELRYKATELKSAKIYVDFETSNIEAEGTPNDTAKKGYVNTPVLVERGEKYEGVKMRYNFKTLRGFITSAESESEGTRYTGEKIKKVDQHTFFIEDGIYTTCDNPEPHYHFYSPEMKLIHKEQIAAKWIFLYFGGVPFPIPLPFAVFPVESGRRSGLIAPTFGDRFGYGRYFKGFGYFWAISDYMDLKLSGDYYTRGGFGMDGRFRYAKRYNYTGSLTAAYAKLHSGETTDASRTESIDWRILWNHNQNINPTMRLDANMEFLSSTYLQNQSYDLNQNLRNDIRSSASLSKTWDESGNSATLSYSRNQSLETGDIQEILPSFRFNMAQSYPFRKSSGSSDQKWYELFGYNYSAQFQNNRNKSSGQLKIRGGIEHNINMSFSPKIGYFSISPNLSYKERWYNKRIEKENLIFYDSASQKLNDQIVTRDVNEINFVRTFRLGVSAGTKFFGVFQPNVLGISVVRHTVTPNISYNYTPDFSAGWWGYYDTYTSASGQNVKYNKFEQEIFGGPPGRESQSIGFSLGNNFEMKTTVDPTDTTSKEKKIQLLNLSANINYDFTADSLKLSDLRLDYRTQAADFFSFNGSSTFSLYDWDGSGKKINKFLIDEGKGLMRLTNFNFSITTSLSGERLKKLTEAEQADEFVLQQNESKIYTGIYDEKEADFSIPWDISLNYYFSYSRLSPDKVNKTSNISGNFNFNLTKNWKLSFAGSYDFTNKEFAAPQVRISRDLHCWIMNFTWNPIGTYRGYRFEIRVKAPQLQDLKLTKQDQFFNR